MVQIEVQATTSSQIPKAPKEPESSEGDASSSEARALTDGSQSGTAGIHDVSPNAPSGNSSPGSGKGSSSTSGSGSSEGASGRHGDSQGGAGTSEDSSSSSSKKGSSKSGSKAASPPTKTGSSSNPSGGSSSQSGTIGGRGTQEDYQEARLRFMNSGTGVIVSADSISLDEGQIGSLVTASFDEL